MYLPWTNSILCKCYHTEKIFHTLKIIVEIYIDPSPEENQVDRGRYKSRDLEFVGNIPYTFFHRHVLKLLKALTLSYRRVQKLTEISKDYNLILEHMLLK